MTKGLLNTLQGTCIPLLFFGSTFKVQHWPFAGIIFYIAIGLTLFCFAYQIWRMSKLNMKGGKVVYAYVFMVPLSLLVYLNEPGHTVKYFYVAVVFIFLTIINLKYVTPKLFNSNK